MVVSGCCSQFGENGWVVPGDLGQRTLDRGPAVDRIRVAHTGRQQGFEVIAADVDGNQVHVVDRVALPFLSCNRLTASSSCPPQSRTSST
jgi:hypothetical protein